MALLVLWDVDHTMIENAGVSKAIYSAAYEAVSGRRAEFAPVTEGRTDRLIMRDLFQAGGVAEPGWPRVAAALESAGRARLDELRRVGWALPGVFDALWALGDQDGVVQGVLTGNIRANAAMKLTAFGLCDLVDLDVGAYGCDHEARGELVAIAQRRAIAKTGRLFGPDNTVLIGDTPNDVWAARFGRARVVAVASGVHSESDLRAAGAEVVLPDLSDTARVLVTVLRTASTA